MARGVAGELDCDCDGDGDGENAGENGVAAGRQPAVLVATSRAAKLLRSLHQRIGKDYDDKGRVPKTLIPTRHRRRRQRRRPC